MGGPKKGRGLMEGVPNTWHQLALVLCPQGPAAALLPCSLLLCPHTQGPRRTPALCRGLSLAGEAQPGRARCFGAVWELRAVLLRKERADLSRFRCFQRRGSAGRLEGSSPWLQNS